MTFIAASRKSPSLGFSDENGSDTPRPATPCMLGFLNEDWDLATWLTG